MKGPYTLDLLREAVAAKSIDVGEYCWRQGFHEWRPICTIADVSEAPGPCLLTPYPSVEVPAGPVAHRAPERKTAPQPPVIDGKTVHLRLSRSYHLRMGMLERAAMIVFAVVLAYAASWVALSEVEEQTHRFLTLMTLGRPVSVGETPETALPPEFWAPVASAPGVLEVAPQMPVIVKGLAQAGAAQGHWKVGSWSLRTNAPWEPWAPTGEGLDPVYVQPVSFVGSWNPAQPESIAVRLKGYPGL